MKSAKKPGRASAVNRTSAAAVKKAATDKRAALARRRAAAARKRTAWVKGGRPDFGAPIDGFFARQPPHLRAILEALREMIDEAAPEADSSLKWGMPFFSIRGAMMCALGGHKSHVNLILSGPPGAFADPDGRLAGEGKTGRHLKAVSLDELPREAVRGWLRTAAKLARAGKAK